MSSPPLRRSAALTLAATSLGMGAVACGGDGHDRRIELREKVKAVTFVHSGKAGQGERLATGDRAITTQRLFDPDGSPVGTLYTDCVNVGPAAQVFAASLSCVSTYRLAKGTLVGVGVVRLGAPGQSVPIVGGTGTYRDAQGDIAAGKPVKGYDSSDVVELEG